MASTYKTLSYHFRPPVVHVVLERPRALNRVNLAMAVELRQVCQRLREEAGARVAILSGRGNVFSSGRDRLSLTSRARRMYSPSEWLARHQAAPAVAGLELPVIAAINGDAVDHGLELALACDLRIASSDARLGFTDLSRGTIPWDGGTQRLPRLVGRARALELLLTSRLMDAEEACKAGLVTAVVPREALMTSAEELALKIASGAPIAARYAKEAVLKGNGHGPGAGMRLEADLNIILQSTADRAEGLRSFSEHRGPKFEGE